MKARKKTVSEKQPKSPMPEVKDWHMLVTVLHGLRAQQSEAEFVSDVAGRFRALSVAARDLAWATKREKAPIPEDRKEVQSFVASARRVIDETGRLRQTGRALVDSYLADETTLRMIGEELGGASFRVDRPTANDPLVVERFGLAMDRVGALLETYVAHQILAPARALRRGERGDLPSLELSALLDFMEKYGLKPRQTALGLLMCGYTPDGWSPDVDAAPGTARRVEDEVRVGESDGKEALRAATASAVATLESRIKKALHDRRRQRK